MLKLIAKAHARFIADDKGATAIEYGLIAAGIAVAIMVTVGLLGDELNSMFDGIKTQLAGEGTGA